MNKDRKKYGQARAHGVGSVFPVIIAPMADAQDENDEDKQRDEG